MPLMVLDRMALDDPGWPWIAMDRHGWLWMALDGDRWIAIDDAWSVLL